LWAGASFSSIKRRNSLESTSTGRKKFGLQAIHFAAPGCYAARVDRA